MSVKGSLKDISLFEMLSLCHTFRKTGRIELSRDNQWAMVVINEGEVWHIEPQGFEGDSPLEILKTLMELETNFTFQRVYVLPTLPRSFEVSTTDFLEDYEKKLTKERLLKEATEKADGINTKMPENDADMDDIVPPEKSEQFLVFKPGGETKVRYAPPDVKRVVALIDGKHSIEDIIKASNMEESVAADLIQQLVIQEVAEIIREPLKDDEAGETTE